MESALSALQREPDLNFSFGHERMPADGGYEPPRFDRWTAFLLFSGQATIRSGGEEEVLVPGSCILLPPGLAYSYAAEQGEAHLVGWCDSSRTERFVTVTPARRVPMTHRLETIYQLGLDSEALPAMERDPLCRHLGHALVQEMQRSVLKARVGGPIAARVAQVVNQDLRYRWTLNGMAQVLGMSPRTFARRLEVEGGLSFHEALWLERVKRAITLLGHSSMGIADIAEICGFASVYHFSRRVKKSTGRPPAELRRWLDDCSLADRQRMLAALDGKDDGASANDEDS